ncbi:MAG: polyhydroxyalkanoate depolymerase [Betaproteobacteria bacterium]|nr:polyhydroxyalkanoate depolymerase [Betaproteobacteria bacterium]
MIYAAYDALARQGELMRQWAALGAELAGSALSLPGAPAWRQLAADLEVMSLLGLTHTRPDFPLAPVTDARGEPRPILVDTVDETPFCRLLRFRKAGARDEPRVLLVAPMSGHFSTLLSGTLRTLLQDHEVCLTDWINARDIPPECGRFGFDEYVLHLIRFLQALGPPTHLVGVCQPTVACLAATALMAADQDDCQPASLVLMAGPIDTRHSPTRVNQMAQENPIEWFERNLISAVPAPCAGAGRRVYPGFVQLTAFMSMNQERHRQSFLALRDARVAGDHARADAIRDFYREYFAVMDLPAEFYLETVRSVFQAHDLPLGRLQVRGRPVDCSAIRRPFLLTIEGERDDICGIGQTLAAQDLCSRMPVYRKAHLLQPGVGHYGVFSGRRWERRIYPAVREFIQWAQ